MKNTLQPTTAYQKARIYYYGFKAGTKITIEGEDVLKIRKWLYRINEKENHSKNFKTRIKNGKLTIKIYK